MYRKQKWQRRLLFLTGGTAIGICLALIVFFIYILVLRTEYRATCLEVNDVILHSDLRQGTVERNGKEWPLSREVLEYYNMRLMGENVTVYSRRDANPNEKSIWIRLGDYTLCFTGLEDGHAIHVSWKTPRERKSYMLRSESVSFVQDSAFLSNYVRSLS